MLPHIVTIRKYYFWSISFDGTRLQPLQRLTNDLVRFIQFAHSNLEPGPNVTIRLNGNFKIVGFVTGIRIRAPNVDLHTAPPEARPCQSPINGIFFGNDTNTFRSALPQGVSSNKRLESVEGLRKIVEELLTPTLETGREIHHQAADAKIARCHPSARRRFDKVQYFLAMTEAIKENGHCSD